MNGTPPNFRWRNVRTLVTGARGFIASHLCRQLARAGATVIGTSSRIDTPESPDFEMNWERVDLVNLEKVRGTFRRFEVEVVFHLASCVTGSLGVEHVEPTFAANLVSSVHVLTAAAECGVRRVILVGSGREPDDSDSRQVPCSPYAAAKWASTGYARMFHQLYGLPVVVARPTMVYGPGQWDVTKVLPYTITSLLRRVAPSVTGGAQQFDWIFVDDVVSGLLATAEASGTDGRVVDIGSGELTSLREVLEQVVLLIGSDVPVHFGAVPDRPFDGLRAARVHETNELVGWRSRTPLLEGLRQTIHWYRETWCNRTCR